MSSTTVKVSTILKTSLQSKAKINRIKKKPVGFTLTYTLSRNILKCSKETQVSAVWWPINYWQFYSTWIFLLSFLVFDIIVVIKMMPYQKELIIFKEILIKKKKKSQNVSTNHYGASSKFHWKVWAVTQVFFCLTPLLMILWLQFDSNI